MAGFIISSVVIGIVFITMVSIGMVQLKSRHPVRFYNGDQELKDEDVTDVEVWNRKHGWMWIIYGCVILGSHIIGMFLKNSLLSCIVMLVSVVGGLIVMMVYHQQLEKEYKRR